MPSPPCPRRRVAPDPNREKRAGFDGWKAAGALLATSFDYLEPDSTGAWRPVLLQRAEDRSFYFCSG